MISLRKKYRILRTNLSEGACGFPDTSFHGVKPWCKQFADYDRYVGVMFAGKESGSEEPQILYIASNAYWEALEVTLPRLPKTLGWKLLADTNEPTQTPAFLESCQFSIGGRSVMILAASHLSEASAFSTGK